MENMNDFEVGDRVEVSPSATGYGADIEGYVTKIERFAGADFISVDYCEPAPNGDLGIVISNPELIAKRGGGGRRR